MRPAVVLSGLVLAGLVGIGIALGLGVGPGLARVAPRPAASTPPVAIAPPPRYAPIGSVPSAGPLELLGADPVAAAVATPFGGPPDGLPALHAHSVLPDRSAAVALALAQAGPLRGLAPPASSPVAEAPGGLLLLVVAGALARRGEREARFSGSSPR